MQVVGCKDLENSEKVNTDPNLFSFLCAAKLVYFNIFPSKIVPIFTEDEDDIAQVIIDFQKAGFAITVPKVKSISMVV